MRQSKASYAIIKHYFGGKEFYLLQLNKQWNNQYNFISGHIEGIDNDNYKNTIIREVEEELPPLMHQNDFTVRPIIDQPFQKQSFSLSAKQITCYTFYLFHVRFLKPCHDFVFLWEQDNSLNKWFTENELITGISKDGSRITRFPVPDLITFIPGGLAGLPDSFSN